MAMLSSYPPRGVLRAFIGRRRWSRGSVFAASSLLDHALRVTVYTRRARRRGRRATVARSLDAPETCQVLDRWGMVCYRSDMPTNPDPNRRSILLDAPAELLADVDALVARKRAASPDGRISRNRVLCELLRAGLRAEEGVVGVEPITGYVHRTEAA